MQLGVKCMTVEKKNSFIFAGDRDQNIEPGLNMLEYMRIDAHLSALNRNCHLRAHSIWLERSICKGLGSLIAYIYDGNRQ